MLKKANRLISDGPTDGRKDLVIEVLRTGKERESRKKESLCEDKKFWFKIT